MKTNRTIKTSVIVPVYNTADYLNECFESIFNQTQKEVEVIAINDGSTDDSLCILEQIKKNHPEMVIYSQNNRGLGSARNKGMELATGEFIYFMDSDDCLIETALEMCYQYAKDNRLDIVMFDAEEFGDIEYETRNYDRSGIIADLEVVFKGVDFANKYWLRTFSPSACLVYLSNQFLKKYDLKFLPRIYYEDNEFHYKIMLLAERVMYIPYVLYRRRYRKDSITTTSFDMRHAKDYLSMINIIRTYKCCDELNFVTHKLQLTFLKCLINKCLPEGLLLDLQYAQEIYGVALDICGRNINVIEHFSDIDVLHRIARVIPERIISQKIKDEIAEKRKEIVEKIFVDIPFQSGEKCVGIYGTGKNTDFLMNVYQEVIGNIKATVIFIDSKTRSKEKKYRGFDIFNINDIGGLSIECIIIASSRYESIMYQMIKEKYGNEFKIIRLQKDMQF